MTKTQRFFRVLWRANAVLILLSTAAISFLAGSLVLSQMGWNFDRRRVAAVAPPVVGPESTEQLYLGQVVQVEGTDTLRGELLAPGVGKGFSSGSYGSEVRNLLFLDGQSKTARWLLPDSHHVVSRSMDIMSIAGEAKPSRLVAEVLLVKPIASDADSDAGSLLLLDPPGRQVKTIAQDVRAVNHARLGLDGRITVLYERNRKYVLATFDSVSLEKKSEDELSIPQLN